jgi:hypothetical protein
MSWLGFEIVLIARERFLPDWVISDVVLAFVTSTARISSEHLEVLYE